MKWVACIVFVLCGVLVTVCVLVGWGIAPQNTGMGVTVAVLVTSAVLLTVVWVVLWIRSDRNAKISTLSLLFIWFWVTGLTEAAASRWGIARNEWGILGVSVSPTVLVGVGLLLVLAAVQAWLRRRWRADGGGTDDVVP